MSEPSSPAIMSCAIPAAASCALFSVGERTFKIQDVLAAAQFRGELQPLVTRLAARLQHIANATEDAAPSQREVQSATDSWRIKHDLISAEETEAWVTERGMTMDEFCEFFQRACWSEVGTKDASALLAAEPPLATLNAELWLSGAMDRLITRFAREQAAIAEAGASVDSAMAYEQSIAQALDEQAMKRGLNALSQDLTRLTLEQVEFESLAAAREAVCCVRIDGLSLNEVAQEGGYLSTPFQRLTRELPKHLRQRVLSLAEGDVLDPIDVDGCVQVVQLIRKSEPVLEDPNVRDAVSNWVLQQHFDELLQRHVRWIVRCSTNG